MEQYDFLINELNNALKEYYTKDRNNGFYNILFAPLQEVSKVLDSKGISIFDFREPQIQTQNLNHHLEKLKELALEATNRILEDTLYLIRPIAGKYHKKFTTMESDDLEGEGILSLYSVIKEFNPLLGIPFRHYATRSIKNNIRRAINERWLMIKLPISNFPKYNKMLEHFENDFQERLGRFPTDEELSHLMHVTVKYVKDFRWMKRNLYSPLSLDILILDDGEDKKDLLDTIADENSDFETNTIREILKQKFIKDYISKLPDAERSVLLGQLENKTLVDIAKEKNCTKQWTSQLKLRGVERIKALREFKEIKKMCRVK